MQEVNLLPHRKGDTWKGKPFQLKDGASPYSLLGYTSNDIICQFRKDKPDGELVKELEIGKGITITDASLGYFQLDPMLIDWPAGKYYYDVQCLIGSDEVTIAGGTFYIEQDVTNKITS